MTMPDWQTLGLPSWIKTSGSKGYHIVVPLDGKAKTGDVARFANRVGALFVSHAPDRLTQEFSKADRKGRIYRNPLSAFRCCHGNLRSRANLVVPSAYHVVAGAKVAEHFEDLASQFAAPDVHPFRHTVPNPDNELTL